MLGVSMHGPLGKGRQCLYIQNHTDINMQYMDPFVLDMLIIVPKPMLTQG